MDDDDITDVTSMAGVNLMVSEITYDLVEFESSF